MEASILRTLSRLAMMSYSPITTMVDRLETFVPPKSISIGPSVFRKFTCVPGCSACCLQGPLTLDFIPTERAWINLPENARRMFTKRTIIVGDLQYEFYSLDKPKGMCYFLVPHAGGQGCGIWDTHPLECFAAARLQIQKRGEDAIILKKGFAREWRWEVHAQCQYDEPFEFEQSELMSDLHVLNRYMEWAKYFHLSTVLDQIIGKMILAYQTKLSQPWIDKIDLR